MGFDIIMEVMLREHYSWSCRIEGYTNKEMLLKLLTNDIVTFFLKKSNTLNCWLNCQIINQQTRIWTKNYELEKILKDILFNI